MLSEYSDISEIELYFRFLFFWHFSVLSIASLGRSPSVFIIGIITEGDEVLLTDPDESFSGFASEELPRERQKDIEIITKQKEKQKGTSKMAKKNPKQPKTKGNKQSMSSTAPISDNNLI